MRKLFKERKLFKGGNYMRKYSIYIKGTEVITQFSPKEQPLAKMNQQNTVTK